MAIKKRQLYTHLLEVANTFRRDITASSCNDYVRTTLFMKYVSDRFKDDAYAAFILSKVIRFADLIKIKCNSRNICEK